MMRSLSLFLLFGTLSHADENWPSFRGPTGDGQTRATGLPTSWSEKENIRWKTAIHDKGWSSPVIWGKQIWLTTAREDGKELFAVCVDRDSGKVVHDLKIFAVEKPAFCHPVNSYASPTPVVEEGRVYVHFGSPGTACLDSSTGKVLWTRRDFPCDHFRGAGSSPVLYKDLLVLTFDGFDHQYVVALDKMNGKTVWKKERDIRGYDRDDGDWKKAYSTPTIVEVQGKPLLVSPSAGQTIAYDARDGKELWRVTHGGMNASLRPLFGHDRFYLTSGYGNKLVAVKPDGTSDWTLTKPSVPSRSSMLLVGEYLYMVSDAGVASCVEAKTGNPVATERVPGAYYASPLFTEGKICFFSLEGPVYVMEAKPELKVLNTNKLDDGFMASPAVSGKALFLRTRTHLYRIEKN